MRVISVTALRSSGQPSGRRSPRAFDFVTIRGPFLHYSNDAARFSGERERSTVTADDPSRAAQDLARAEQRRFAGSFFSRISGPARFEDLFDYLPEVYFFVKDAEGRFVRANRAFLRLVRANTEEDVIGARDSAFFPANWAESYTRDDREVLRRGEGMVDKAELVRHADGRVSWFCTTKLPVRDVSGQAIGVCGIMRDVKKMTNDGERFPSWAPVLETILSDYATPIGTAELAQKASLSVSQFNRQFRKRFRSTPHAYLTNVRLNAARHFLVTTEMSMSEIAHRTGFCDQSHFTNHFVKAHGLPPSKYRGLHAGSAVLAQISREGTASRASSKETSVFSKGET
jgi:PAS domain S-box-containing protein